VKSCRQHSPPSRSQGSIWSSTNARCRREISHRLRAALLHEILIILAEGESVPEHIDQACLELFKEERAPCKLMDHLGLDVVVIEDDDYVKRRNTDPRIVADWLREEFISKGRLGERCSNGGLYANSKHGNDANSKNEAMIYFLDIGLGSNVEEIERAGQSGKILRAAASGGEATTIVTGLNCPDGIDISPSAGRLFWTNMGSTPSLNNGSVMSANLDGSDSTVIIPEGAVHTAKQIVVDDKNHKIYFCDREGLGVHRCDFGGQNHEIIVQRGDWKTSDQKDMTRWCVGVAVDDQQGKFYWTQKGPSKGGKGRIFRANTRMPDGENAWNRSDIETLFEGLPEPIDLDLETESQCLYWTDRGEYPTGSTLNKAYIGANRHEHEAAKPTIIASHFHEPIGLKICHQNNHIYVTDLGGGVYRFDLDGADKRVIRSDDGAYTGITLLI
jgi:hypothetical protein